MFTKPIADYFTEMERVPASVMKKQSEVFAENKLLKDLIDSLSQMLLVINAERQIVYANKPYLDFCDIKDLNTVVGKRPGEVFDCKNASLTQLGCSTSDLCKTCGAANSIWESRQGIQSTKDCEINTNSNVSYSLRVTSTPFDFNGQSLTIFAMIDISNEKRKELLERVFFHDILNTAGGISGLASILLETTDRSEILDIANTISQAAENLVDEIQMQSQLSEAEKGKLKPEIKEISSMSILEDVKNLYSMHQTIVDKSIIIDESSQDIKLNSDSTLLRRVLGNMVKNAIEVYYPNDLITLKCQSQNGQTLFSVHNRKYVKPEVQQQLFKRSFTTKEMGQGLGTYSMKLLGENFLGGTVWFESTKEDGTTFYISI